MTGTIQIKGWSLSEEAIQRFKLTYSSALRRQLDLEASDLTIQSRSGPLQLQGYQFVFGLVPRAELANQEIALSGKGGKQARGRVRKRERLSTASRKSAKFARARYDEQKRLKREAEANHND